MSIDRLLVGFRSVLAIRVRRLELEVSSCHVLGDLHKILWPLHLHAFASDRVLSCSHFLCSQRWISRHFKCLQWEGKRAGKGQWEEKREGESEGAGGKEGR